MSVINGTRFVVFNVPDRDAAVVLETVYARYGYNGDEFANIEDLNEAVKNTIAELGPKEGGGS